MSVRDLTDAIGAAAETNARPPYRVFRDYLGGRHVLKFASADFETTYGDLLKSLRENLCPMVRSGFTDTLGVRGWGSPENDRLAEDMGLDRLTGFVDAEAWGAGDAYVIVWPNRAGVRVPSFQRAELMIPTVDAENPAVLARLVKRWIDPRTGHGRAMILYPDHVERYVTTNALLDKGAGATSRPNEFPTEVTAWTTYAAPGEESTLPNWSGEVLPACWWKLDAADVEGYGRSILTDVIPLQDALNKAVADLILLSENYARPFWYLLKYKAAETVAALNPFTAAAAAPAVATNPLLSGPDATVAAARLPRRFNPNRQRIFTTSGEGPFGQLDPPDAERLIAIHTEFKTKVAGVVGLPMYYLAQTSGDVPSGQSLRVLSERRTARARRYQRDSNPVLKGLGELLGMTNPVVEWEPITGLDPLEQWDIAEAQHRMGLDIADTLEWLDYPDRANVAARAKAVSDQRAADQRAGLGGFAGF